MSSTGPSLIRYRGRGPIARVLSAPRCETPHVMLSVSHAFRCLVTPEGPPAAVRICLPMCLAASGSAASSSPLRVLVRLSSLPPCGLRFDCLTFRLAASGSTPALPPCGFRPGALARASRGLSRAFRPKTTRPAAPGDPPRVFRLPGSAVPILQRMCPAPRSPAFRPASASAGLCGPGPLRCR